MPNDKAVVELQNKWNENRYEIIDRLDAALLEILREGSVGNSIRSQEAIGKLAPARLMFFQEFLTLAALSDRTDEAMNAYTFARGEGGNA
jgi:hypothetical protein